MNTNGKKFLAVLAVLAMAFVAFAVIAPAETNDAAATAIETTATVGSTNYKLVAYDPDTTEIQDGYGYYITDDRLSISVPEKARVVFFIDKGLTLTLNGISGTASTSTADAGFAYAAFVNVSSSSGTTLTMSSDAKLSYDNSSSGSFLYYADNTTTAITTMATSPIWGHECHSWEADDVFSMTANSNGTGFSMTGSNTDVDVYNDLTLTGTYGDVKFKTGKTLTLKGFTGTIKSSNDTVKFTDFDGTVPGTTSTVTITGWTAGNVEITAGELTQADAVTIPSVSTLTITTGTFASGTSNFINKGVVVINDNTNGFKKTSGTFTNDGKFTINGKVSSAQAMLNTGTITFKPGCTLTPFTLNTASTGRIINQTNAETEISGVIESSPTSFDTNQKVTLSDDLIVKQTLTINGILEIPEGVTLTITDSGCLKAVGLRASIINNGTIEVTNQVTTYGGLYVNNATIVNNGLIEVRTTGDGTAPSVVVGGGTNYSVMTNNGVIIHEAGNFVIAANSQFNNSVGAIATFEGDVTTVNTAMISNGGILNLGGLVATSDTAVTIGLVSAGAIVNVEDLIVDGVDDDGSEAITISNLVVNTGSSYNDDGTATVTLKDSKTAKTHYQGLTVKAAWYNDGTKNYRALDLSGSYNAVNTSGVAVAGYDLFAVSSGASNYGFITVSDSFSIVDEADLDLNNATLIIKGEMTVGKNGGVITNASAGTNVITVVSGSLVSPVIASATATINAAYYIDSTIYHYMPLGTVIDAAQEAGLKKVYTSGTLDVSKDVVIPADITVNNGARLTVKPGYTITVLDGGVLNTTTANAITVQGSVYAEDAKTGIKGTEPAAEVKQSGIKDVRYTTLSNAVATASLGDVIEVTSDSGAIIAADLTIPEGVTVSTNDQNLTINSKVNVIVDGALIIEGGTYTKADDANIVVNGYLLTDRATSYSGGWPAGAYYVITIGTTDYNAICGLTHIADVADAGEAYSFDVYGSAKTPIISVAGTSDTSAKITFNGNVEASTIAVNTGSIVFKADTSVKAKVTNGTSAVSMNADIIADVTIADSSKSGFTIKGTTGYDVNIDDEKYYVKLDGPMSIVGTAVLPAAEIYGDVAVSGSSTTAATATLNGAVVYGNLTASYYSTTTADDMTVEGTLTTLTEDTTKTLGKVNISGQLIIGEIGIYTGAAASVTGNVVLGDAACAIVVSGSTIDSAIVDGLKVTEITVDGVLWLTIYGNGEADLSYFNIPVVNGKATYFGDEAIEEGFNYLDDGTKIAIGDDETIDIAVKYDIYNVAIVTDSGIKSVAIDNIEMIRDGGSNIFYAYDDDHKVGVLLKAGVHTVSYTLYNGYEGTATLYTMDNTILKDLKFTVSGTNDLTYSFQLYGTEQIVTPEPSPVEQSEWTITTILLVILVILIAIMAVIVAIRLNRS